MARSRKQKQQLTPFEQAKLKQTRRFYQVGVATRVGVIGGALGYKAYKSRGGKGGGLKTATPGSFKYIRAHVKSANRHARFERYYSARTKAQRAGMRFQAAKLRMTPIGTFNRKNQVIDLRTSSHLQRHGLKYAVAGAALGGAAYGAHRYARHRRTRRNYKGQFAGSY